MDKDNKILIVSVIIIILVALSFNFNIPTGAVTKDYPTISITISPDIVQAGDIVYIDIKAGKSGINNRADFIYAIDNLRKSSKTNICGNAPKCTGDLSFSYVTSPTWESGIYYIAVYDYDSETFIKKEFTIS